MLVSKVDLDDAVSVSVRFAARAFVEGDRCSSVGVYDPHARWAYEHSLCSFVAICHCFERCGIRGIVSVNDVPDYHRIVYEYECSGARSEVTFLANFPSVGERRVMLLRLVYVAAGGTWIGARRVWGGAWTCFGKNAHRSMETAVPALCFPERGALPAAVFPERLKLFVATVASAMAK